MGEAGELSEQGAHVRGPDMMSLTSLIGNRARQRAADWATDLAADRLGPPPARPGKPAPSRRQNPRETRPPGGKTTLGAYPEENPLVIGGEQAL